MKKKLKFIYWYNIYKRNSNVKYFLAKLYQNLRYFSLYWDIEYKKELAFAGQWQSKKQFNISFWAYLFEYYDNVKFILSIFSQKTSWGYIYIK